MRVLLKTGLSCLLALIACIGFSSPSGAVQVGDKAPAFSLTDLDGSTHSLADEAGNVVFLFFFGYQQNIDVCRTPAQDIEHRFHQGAQYRGLTILGIDCFDNAESAQQFQSLTGVQFPLLLAGKATMQSYDVSYNSFVVVDGTGTVTYVSSGPDLSAYDANGLDTAIRQAMQDAADTRDQTWGQIKSLYNASKSKSLR